MERSKIIVWVLVLAAAGVIIWWVGFHSVQSPLPAAEQKAAAKEAPAGESAKQKQKAPAQGGPGTASDANRPKSAARPAGGEPNQPAQAQSSESKPGPTDPNRPGQPAGAAAAKPEEARPGTLMHFVLTLGDGMLREGVTFGVTDEVKAGIRVKLVGENVRIDLTEATLSQLLMRHLLPRFRAVLRGAVATGPAAAKAPEPEIKRPAA